MFLFLFLAGIAAVQPAMAFDPNTFSADEGCQWRVVDSPGLHMNAHYIAAPTEGQDYGAWLDELRRYRQSVREGMTVPILSMTYDGTRAWTRLSPNLSKALALVPGDELQVSLEARWIEGGNVICAAFDVRDAKTGAWQNWSGVVQTSAIPRDGDWHSLDCALKIPPCEIAGRFIQPIFGMDSTHSSEKATIEVRALSLTSKDAERQGAYSKALENLPFRGIDRSLYDREDLKWVAQTRTCQKTLVWDKAFYDPGMMRYTFDQVLADGEKEFGGYDVVVLWQGYPRLGFDERNQFDMYRDLPGGLEALREQVRLAHARGVRFFIDYNPWDTGTRREPKPDEGTLADLVAEIEADGIFLDTMTGTAGNLRQAVDHLRPGVAFIPELHPPIGQLAICSGSWAQYLNDPMPPGLLHLKWLEPRHAQYQTRRWEAGHRGEIETAFFNGSGFMVWENIFGTYNPCPFEDRHLWRRCVRILKRFPQHFGTEVFEPFTPTLNPKVFAHMWPQGDAVLYTLFNAGDPVTDQPVLAMEPKPGMLYLDLLNGRRLKEADVAGKTQISIPLERLGCFLAIPQSSADETLRQFVLDQRALGELQITEDHRNFALSVVEPKRVKPTKPVSLSSPPSGMVPVPAAQFHMRFKHMRRECGTYPDPGTPKDRWKEFLWGSPHDQILERDLGVVPIKAIFMDEAEVSNAEYKRFLDAAGYKPKMTQNFLKHWPNGEMPEDLAEYPVVYVDLEDARAYTKWAGKRLPTEAEWQLAAQGTDEREWPWGGEFDPSKCNTSGNHTLAVRSLPEGRSPFGCYHMSGNVWEWTESERDDGHVRFAILRGGSYFKAEGSIWYAPGGPLPVTTHAKFLLMAPSLDRCATVGFRCVMDAE